MENAITLIETNLISPKRFDEYKLLKSMKKVLTSHGSFTLVIEDYSSLNNRKGERSKKLARKIKHWARRKGIDVKQYTRDQVREVFSRWLVFTKYEIAQVLVKNIRGLESFMYKPIKYPGREHNYEAIFSAVSLGVTHYFFND